MVPRITLPEPPLRPPIRPQTSRLQSAKSIRSYQSSFEADDERSSSSSEDERMDGDPEAATHRGLKAEYPGEDTRLTSKNELAGWYCYGFAAEVFVICGMGSFIPITLEQLARENGVLLSDHKTPCTAPHITSPSPISIRGNGNRTSDQCVITFVGIEINTASFAMFSFSLSVLFQFLVVISISCAADHGHYRKKLLLIFAWTGAVATMLFLPITPAVYLLGALLAIIANTCLGASFVLLNSFLPLLVRHHPEVQEELERTYGESNGVSEDDDEPPLAITSSASALLEPDSLALPRTSMALTMSTRISSTGIGISYGAALFLQVISILILLSMHSSAFSLQLVLFLIGAWWFCFTIPSALWLRPRPGPPLPSRISSSSWSYISHSWISLWRTIRLTPQLPDILLFLLAWFLLSDAIATVSGVSILYAKTTLHMPPDRLALISVLVTIAGLLGALLWPKISHLLGLTPLRTILVSIGLFTLIPLYGLLDYIPGVYTLNEQWEMYPLGLLYGFILGGLSSYCRSLYGELIPPGYEASFYALYAITDKGSSIFGPAIVGVIIDQTGGIRPAFWFLLVLTGAPAFIICWVDVKRGKVAAGNMGAMIEGQRKDAIVQRDGAEESAEVEGLLNERVERRHTRVDAQISN